MARSQMSQVFRLCRKNVCFLGFSEPKLGKLVWSPHSRKCKNPDPLALEEKDQKLGNGKGIGR